MANEQPSFMMGMVESAEKAIEQWNAASSALREFGYDADTKITQVRYSISELDQGFRNILEFIASLKLRPKASASLLHDGEWNQLITSLDAVASYSEKLASNLNKLATHHVAAKTETLTYTGPAPGNHVAAVKQIFDTVQAALHAAFAMAPGFRIQGVGDLKARAEAYRTITEELGVLLDDGASLKVELQGLVANAVKAEQQIKESESKSSTAEAELEKSASAAAQTLGEAQQVVGSIKEKLAEARTLESQVQQYSADFTAFQEALDERLENLTETENRQAEIFAETENQQKLIQETIDKADGMLAGATVAGLSTSFSDALATYDERLKKARTGFYVGILLLFVSVVPLALYIVGFQPMTGEFVHGFEVTAAGIVGRLTLLIPGSWLVRLQARRYYDLFGLQRQYALKTALARALDGFKKQAPEYEDEMAATVLTILADDEYALGKRSGQARDANPLFKAVIDRLEGESRKRRDNTEDESAASES